MQECAGCAVNEVSEGMSSCERNSSSEVINVRISVIVRQLLACSFIIIINSFYRHGILPGIQPVTYKVVQI